MLTTFFIDPLDASDHLPIIKGFALFASFFASGELGVDRSIDEDSEWLHVLYQGSNLYIKKTDASAVGKLENEDAAKELEKTAQMDKSWIESYIVQMKAIRSGRIWRTVIAVMIVAVIVFIVMNSIRRNTSGKIK